MSIGYESVLARLKEQRVKKEWSQMELSRLLQMEQSHYSKVEQGKKRLTYYEMQRLCHSGMDVHYIYTGKQLEGTDMSYFDSCSYSELFCFIGILYAMVSYLGTRQPGSDWEKLCGQMDYMKYVRYSYKQNSNIFYLVRQYTGYSQYEMAEILHVDIKKLRTLETGRVLPDSEMLWMMYDLFHIPPAVILQDEKGLAVELCAVLEQINTVDTRRKNRMLAYLKAGRRLLSDTLSKDTE